MAALPHVKREASPDKLKRAARPQHDQFEIATLVSIHERRPRTLKHDDSFAVFDHSGDVITALANSEGFFHLDTRHLSHFYLTMCGGIRPILLSSGLRDDNSVLTCDLSNPDITDDDGRELLQNDLVHVRRTRFIFRACLYERVTIENYQETADEIALELNFASDFADLFEVRGAKRARRGAMLPPQVGPDRVLLGYQGLDGRTRHTSLSFDPPPASLTQSTAEFRFALQPRTSAQLLIEIACSNARSPHPLRRRLISAYREARSQQREKSAAAATIVSSNEIFNQAARRCIADTSMLITQTEYGPYPYAGIPWYSTVFGRDALITALNTLWLDPAIARGVLCYLAANQADHIDPAADAEPGKILHEVRHGEMANLGEVPFGKYYGTIDATPLFVMLAGAYLERTDDLETIDGLWPNIARALQWIDQYGDRDQDGYVEYGRYSEKGLINQGWKDSHDAVFHADGSIAKGPIALAEVQAYIYGAWLAAADILERRGETTNGAAFRRRAAKLYDDFNRDFFDEELGTFVLALDGEKRPCRVRASNAGQVLLTGLATPGHAARVADTLMRHDSFSGWGIRTVAAGEARYNPMSYHNGSIWPHDNALIGAGFARYGLRHHAATIFEGLFSAATYVDLRRMPELFCGYVRRPANGPTFYPVSCIPQAWSATAPISLLQSCLGLTIDARRKMIRFDQPMLPSFLDELTLGKVAIGPHWATLKLCRSGSKVSVEVLDRKGEAQVLTCV
jgi:glycogen debranching enzyme